MDHSIDVRKANAQKLVDLLKSHGIEVETFTANQIWVQAVYTRKRPGDPEGPGVSKVIREAIPASRPHVLEWLGY